MSGVWHWEAPTAFVDTAILIDATTDRRYNARLVEDRFGIGHAPPGDWGWWAPNDPDWWAQCQLVDALSLTRLDVARVACLFGHRFDPVAVVSTPPAMVRARTPGASLDRKQAAEFLGISLTTFKRLVMPGLARIMVGRKVTFDERDLVQWRDMQKAGRSISTTKVGPSIASASRTLGRGTNDPRVRAMMEELERPRRKSTRT